MANTFKSNDVIYFVLAVGDFGRSGRHWVKLTKNYFQTHVKGNFSEIL